jgi:Lysophospholipase L1 and related esterases
MKKIAMYLLSVTMVIAMTNLSIPETAQGAQETVTTTVSKDHTLTLKGISKIKEGPVKAVILGDSIAVSQGASNPLINGWNRDLKKDLYREYSNYIVWDNKALSGSLVDDCLKRATEILSNTDVVFICVGRNDRNFYKTDEFKEKYEQLISLIKEKAPNADIFCVVEPPMVSSNESSFMGIRTTIINVCAQTGSYLLDVWSAFPRDEVGLDPLLKDGLHPNNDGYMRMADYIYNQLDPVINTTQK